LIFQTGNIITTGFKKTEQIKEITCDFLLICNSLKAIIEKKKFL
jgi:TATA-box binding protein (TBP) (component of TFIID and TFIIIB)